MSVKRDKIVKFIDDQLKISEISDASNNGLQVEGNKSISKIGLAVDACMEVYNAAGKKKCDMLIVHHGLIWNGIKFVVGRTYNHVKTLIENNINLYAAHLPLDLHPKIGNNIELSKFISMRSPVPFGNYKGIEIGFSGDLPKPIATDNIIKKIQKIIGGETVSLPFGKRMNSNAAIVSGGGSSALEEAIDKKIDCFITGEGSYTDYHLAKEAGINIIYLGHYHSETAGVKALGNVLEKKFKIRCEFIDTPPSLNHF